MNRKNPRLKKALYLISAAVLLAGLAGSVFIYRAAMNDAGGEAGYEVVGGFIYPSSAESSKRYNHDLQLYGGNAAVLADDFMRWCAGLWHGTSLAFTVAFITLLVSFGFFVAANNIPRRAP